MSVSQSIRYAVDWWVKWVVTDPNRVSEDQKRRKYQVATDTPHVYLLGGRLFFVKKKPYSIAIGVVIVAAGVLYWVSEAAWAWRNQSPAVVLVFTYLWLLSLFYLVKSSTSNPGIQPKNVHIPFDPIKLTEKGPDEYFDTINLPYCTDRYVGVSVKYCAACHIWRLPRMSHCLVCNVCVERHDHHCVYLNNCVGRGNYRYFLWFLLVVLLTCVYLATLMFLHCFRYRDAEHPSFAAFVAHSPITLILAAVASVGLVYPLTILLFHLYLTAQNITTREYLNHARADPTYVNVYDTHSVCRNVALNWLEPPYDIRVVHPCDAATDNLMSKVLPPLTSYSAG